MRHNTLHDIIYISTLLALAGLFAYAPSREWVLAVSRDHSILSSFVKFALLAPLGEMAAIRISQGRYLPPHFGLFPKAVLWGVYGILIKIMFTVFATGVPAMLGSFGLDWASTGLRQELGMAKLTTAFAVSLGMNVIFAPILMVSHKLTDLHVERHHGSVSALWSRPDWAENLARIDWKIMWGFIFAKTIPLFWIPAHTITFMLPPELQILFAAALSMALGLILAIAGAGKPVPSDKA